MSEEFTPIESQEAFDAAIKERIERAKESVRKDYADYDAVKKELEELKGKGAGDGDRIKGLEEKVAAFEKERAEREEADKTEKLRKKVSEETGVPVELIQGADEESMKAFAESVAKFAKKPAAPKVPRGGERGVGEDDSAMKDYIKKLIP